MSPFPAMPGSGDIFLSILLLMAVYKACFLQTPCASLHSGCASVQTQGWSAYSGCKSADVMPCRVEKCLLSGMSLCVCYGIASFRVRLDTAWIWGEIV